MESAIYAGKLRHRRFAPTPHSFEYPVYMAFLDIDRLPELMRGSRFTSYNRWNWTAYCERDHFGDPALPLRQRLVRDAASQGIRVPDGSIFLLTHLRYLGYVFNPVSFFYCFDSAEKLALILAEVNNTFGERCNYWLTPDRQLPNAAANRYSTAKRMHVSPFMPMNLDYDWIFTPPAGRLVAHMNTGSESARIFDATLQLERRPWNAREIRRVLVSYPLVTFRVVAAIHYEALRLWFKRVPVFTHPAKVPTSNEPGVRPPGASVTQKGHLIR